GPARRTSPATSGTPRNPGRRRPESGPRFGSRSNSADDLRRGDLLNMRTVEGLGARFRRIGFALAILGGTGVVSACSNLLDIQLPGRIPSDQVNNPALAATLVVGVVGDFECAYNNFTGGNAMQSDEFETSNGNVPGANWGERTIGADEDDYAIGG